MCVYSSLVLRFSTPALVMLASGGAGQTVFHGSDMEHAMGFILFAAGAV